MKQIITLVLFMLAIGTQSFAINAPVVPSSTNASEISLDYHEKAGFWGNIKHFVKSKFTKIKKFLKSRTEMEKGLILLFAVICAPLGMYFYEGEKWTKRVTLSLILYLCCYFPGLIYSLYIITNDK